jgi:hypothetical protein
VLERYADARQRRVEGIEVGFVEHAVGGEQVGEDGGGGRGVGEGVVVALEGDVVAGAEVGQPWVSWRSGSRRGTAAACTGAARAPAARGPRRRPLDEGGVELGVVGGEHRPGEAVAQLVDRPAGLRRAAQGAPGDAVDLPGPTRLQGQRSRTSVDHSSTTVPSARR